MPRTKKAHCPHCFGEVWCAWRGNALYCAKDHFVRYRGDRKPKPVKVETPKPVEAVVREQPKQKSLRGIQQKLF